VPAFPIAMVATWKLGGCVLLLNPMYQDRELRFILRDSGCAGVICDPQDMSRIGRATNDSSFWTLGVPESWPTADPGSATDLEPGLLAGLVAATHRFPGPCPAKADSPALLTYTSGTTGAPKGALATHSNVLSAVRAFSELIDMGPSDRVLSMAPLFHITGAVINATLALCGGAPLVLTGRFEATTALDLIRHHAVTFTVGSITAYLALLEHPECTEQTFASVRLLYSGGAPIAPATVERFEKQTGHYIHNVYGMTETTSAVVAVPPHVRCPVDATSGALSVGRALPGVSLQVRDENDQVLPSGAQGELVIRGPSVVSGYLNAAEQTAAAIRDGWLRTGDGAVIDGDGWVYLVDRLKDQINTSGYKVWPREVEDVLLAHPAVAQAAVVGVPDGYRGEAVTAYVTVMPGSGVEPQELSDHVRAQLAAYKVPRSVHLVERLPTTTTGKIQRRLLREQGTQHG
jgi:long-chain acyl-CoA synthetase